MNHTFAKRLTSLSATSRVTAVLACSAAPERSEGVETSNQEISVTQPTPVTTCGPCQVDGTQQCSTRVSNMIKLTTRVCSETNPNVYPDCHLTPITRPWPELTNDMSELGCIESGYWQNYDGSRNLQNETEAYALCPISEALVSSVEEGLGPSVPLPHWGPAWDACLAKPVPGWTYLFLAAMNISTPRPTCNGDACQIARW